VGNINIQNKNFKMKSFLSALFLATFMMSCTPDTTTQDPVEDINMVTLEFRNNKIAKSFTYKKVNGVLTQLDTIKMIPNTIDTFTVRVFLSNGTTDAEKTSEIYNENEYHQFFYTFSSSMNAAHRYLDFDVFTNPIGLKNEVSSGSASSGTLQIKLMHQPNIKHGSSTEGSADIQAVFPMIVK
jgi:hypothetical protein